MAVQLNRDELAVRVQQMVAKIASDQRMPLNQREQDMLATQIVDEMVGLGPLEPLLRDSTIADILVNGPFMIYVERRGKLELTKLKFRSDAHVLHVAQRIASSIGRRIDGSSPMLDARLADGSRVNVIISPLSLRGTCVSIRKFSRSVLEFSKFIELGTLSPEARPGARNRRALSPQYHHLRRHGIWQDHGPERTIRADRPERAHHHDRGRRRAATSTTACDSARNAPSEHRGPR